MNPIPFTKMQSSGNDFVIINNFESMIARVNQPDLVKKICSRTYGVGSDGLLILEPDADYSFCLRFLNPDGSEAFCGNGSLCSALLANRLKIAPAQMTFRSRSGIHRATVDGDTVAVSMPPPQDWKLNLRVDHRTGHFINTGAPHTVVFVEECDRVDIKQKGRHIRHHPLFAPGGTNVDFAQVLSASRLKMRTYERGVENETLSCGSGAVAAASTGFLVKQLIPPITCTFPGGNLQVDFKIECDVFTDVTLTNRVVTVFEGTFYFES